MGKILGWLAKATAWLMVLLVVGVCALVNLGNAPFKAERDRERRLAATRLIEALEAHQTARGGYPERLEILVPEYVPALADFDGGGSIQYRRAKDAPGYEISYPEAPYGALPTDGFWVYASSSKDWSYVVY